MESRFPFLFIYIYIYIFIYIYLSFFRVDVDRNARHGAEVVLQHSVVRRVMVP